VHNNYACVALQKILPIYLYLLLQTIQEFLHILNYREGDSLGNGPYSYLNASTGFFVAAFQLCQLTVSKAIPSASKPDRAKIHQLRWVL
jgi:hypothetical protein